jgi:hypothetical protein
MGGVLRRIFVGSLSCPYPARGTYGFSLPPPCGGGQPVREAKYDPIPTPPKGGANLPPLISAGGS